MKSIRGVSVVCMISVFALAACAPGFPETGVPSPFDGNWFGTLASEDPPCDDIDITAVGEVRYGYVIGSAYEDGANRYKIRGAIGPDNRLAGEIGIAGGHADVLFEGNKAQGTWTSSFCDGSVSLIRQ